MKIQFLGQWEIIYSDFTVYSSKHIEWEKLPFIGVQKVFVFYPNENYSMQFSGWDVYWSLKEEDGIRFGVWKDDDPSDPYYDLGQELKFFYNGDFQKTDYLDKRTWSKIPYINRKRGIYLEEGTTRKMGIL
jgi:hypothetical protein